MTAKSPSWLLTAYSGVTMTEYAILFGLVIVLGIGGLRLVGGSISTLLEGSGQKASKNDTLQLLSTQSAAPAPGGGLGLKGSGYYAMMVNPKTGQPELTMVNGANATATNVSSIDGSMMNTLGSAMLAKSLDELAAQQTDPVLRNYYGQMAMNAYYLAGAEGELDNMAGLELSPNGPGGSTYTKGNALEDIIKYDQTLSGLMNNPPSQVNPSAYLQAMPLAVDAFNIAKSYQNAYAQFANSDGSVSQNFGVAAYCSPGGCATGNGTPGSALAYAGQAITGLPDAAKMMNASYDQVVNYTQIKANADAVLASHKVDSLPVASTITDAQDLNIIAQSQTSSSSTSSTVTAISLNPVPPATP